MKPEKFPGDILRNWRRIDLRSRETWPREGTIVVVRMEPKNEREAYYHLDKTDAGSFEPHDSKLYWKGSSVHRYATELKKHYNLWWCYMPEFDGAPY